MTGGACTLDICPKARRRLVRGFSQSSRGPNGCFSVGVCLEHPEESLAGFAPDKKVYEKSWILASGPVRCVCFYLVTEDVARESATSRGLMAVPYLTWQKPYYRYRTEWPRNAFSASVSMVSLWVGRSARSLVVGAWFKSLEVCIRGNSGSSNE
jgi:hypothetical protein